MTSTVADIKSPNTCKYRSFNLAVYSDQLYVYFFKRLFKIKEVYN